MITLRIFLTVIFAAILDVTTSAQHDHSSMGSGSDMNRNMNMNSQMSMLPPKAETLKVWGKCDLCKSCIEKAVKGEGAISVDWNIKINLLTVTFDPAKTSTDAFSKKLAAVGHDTEII